MTITIAHRLPIIRGNVKRYRHQRRPTSRRRRRVRQTITYTIVVPNERVADALGVCQSDTIDLRTTFVAGSLRASPMAAADAHPG